MKDKLRKFISVASVMALLPLSSFLGANVFESGFLISNFKINREPLIRAADRLNIFSGGEILVKLKSEDSSTLNKVFQRHSVSSFSSHFNSIKSFNFASGINLNRKIKELNDDPNVEYAEPNYIAHAFYAPNDPYLNYQWSFGGNSLDMGKVWDVATGKGAIVAVIDTGVAYENYSRYKLAPDLNQTKFVDGYNFVRRSTHANDDQGHGTHIAGTIAQSTNNGVGTAGIAFNASIMPVKVLDKNGAGNYGDISDGIIWAADNGANIINLSLGAPYPSKTLKNALNYAKSKGVFIVAASGNDGAYLVSYPAAYDNYVMAVGATRYDKKVTNYSNKGMALDIVAPGGDTKVDQDRNSYGDGILQQTFADNPSRFGYYFFQGTSMASPHVAAVAALLFEKDVRNPDNIQKIIQDSANDIGQTGWDMESGFGIINPYKALTMAGSFSEPTPTPTEEPPADADDQKTLPNKGKKGENKFVKVENISLSLRSTSRKVKATVKIKIVDQDGNPVRGAIINGSWSGLYNKDTVKSTNSRGYAKIKTSYIRKSSGKFIFDVNSVSKAGFEYDSSNNTESQEEANVN